MVNLVKEPKNEDNENEYGAHWAQVTPVFREAEKVLNDELNSVVKKPVLISQID